ncbi:MAG: signal recognition particle receptor subunit alpha, partial [Polyangiales bacterium]
MFDALTQGFRAARQRLAGQAELSEVVLDEALRDVRRSLLEADVELGVAKDFLAKVKAESLGTVVQTRIRHKGQTHKVSAAEHFIHVCHRELEAMMADEAGQDLCFAPPSGCTGILMVGLQGSGKTTSSAKLARLLEREHGRKVLLVAADVARPGAIEQLQLLGERADIPVFAIPGGRPLDICTRATAEARKLRRDTIIYDTAGRLAIDDALMQELGDIQAAVKPQNA